MMRILDALSILDAVIAISLKIEGLTSQLDIVGESSELFLNITDKESN